MANDKTAPGMISVTKFDTSFGHDAGGDFTLPDYMPEIKRLLYVSSSVLPEGKFLSGNLLELGGNVAYCAVYVGDDGTLASAPLLHEYSADTALPFQPENTESIFVDAEIENTSARATGPRSLNIKSRIRFHVVCDETAEGGDAVLDADGGTVSDRDGGVERLTEDISSFVRRRGSVTESASGEFRAGAGVKPLSCDGVLSVSSAVPDGSGVRVSGKITVRCLMSGDDGTTSAVCEIPFETTVPVDSQIPFTDGRAWGRVASVSIAPSEDDPGLFSINAEYDLDAEAYCKTEAEICTDAYSVTSESENEYRECDAPDMILFGEKRIAVKGDAELKNPSQDAIIIGVSPAACQMSVSSSDGKITAVGTVKFRALVNSDGEIFSQEIEIPVREELGDAPDGMSGQEIQGTVNCAASVASARVSDGRIVSDVELSLTWAVCRRRKIKYVTAVKLGERTDKDVAPCIKVYYPERDESVWSVCKKYRADRTKLMKHNTFDGDVAPKGKPVMIL